MCVMGIVRGGSALGSITRCYHLMVFDGNAQYVAKAVDGKTKTIFSLCPIPCLASKPGLAGAGLKER